MARFTLVTDHALNTFLDEAKTRTDDPYYEGALAFYHWVMGDGPVPSREPESEPEAEDPAE